MNDRLERKLKELLPYIIIIGIIFLLLPLFMGKEGAVTYIIQVGAFPLTAIGCCAHYKLKKKKNDIFLCGVAPVFYALTALLYGMWRDSWFTVLIYLIAYFICGYLGLMIPDLLKIGKDGSKAKQTNIPRPIIRKPSLRPERVNLDEEEKPGEGFKAENPEKDMSLDASTTDDDIEAILNSIHSRKGQ